MLVFLAIALNIDLAILSSDSQSGAFHCWEWRGHRPRHSQQWGECAEVADAKRLQLQRLG
jgi:hypothetical protein